MDGIAYAIKWANIIPYVYGRGIDIDDVADDLLILFEELDRIETEARKRQKDAQPKHSTSKKTPRRIR